MTKNLYPPATVLSVVSHGQGDLVAQLLRDIDDSWDVRNLSVVLTVNVPESLPFDESAFGFPVLVVRNDKPKGFGANHNAAFELSYGALFCVLNPDIRARRDPLPALRQRLADRNRLALVAPKILSPDGEPEDSARRALTPGRILRRTLLRRREDVYTPPVDERLHPDWVAGMFMLLRARDFAAVGGFNERYFMYCEDADLCVRLWFIGRGVECVPECTVVHDAQRASHSSVKHLYWHVTSLLRFFLTFRSTFRKLYYAG